ncbi:hypothetical protein, partial [Vibrio paucivorans]
MSWRRGTYAVTLWLAILASMPVFANEKQTEKVEIGVLAIRGHLYAEQRWQPTLDWLSTQMPNITFVLTPL